CDHAAVADQHDALQPEARPELADLIGQRARIAEVAFEHLDGDRAALRRAQETEDDLRSVGTMVSAVAELRQLAAPPLEIARGDVVEHEHAVLEVALGEGLLDARLAAAQKIEGGVEFVLVDLAQAERRTERVGGGRLAELARGRELGGRLDDPRHDHRQDQFCPALGSLRQHLVEPEPARRPERGGDMAVRQRPGDLEALGGERHEGLPRQHPAQAVDLRLRPVGDVGEGARLDLAVLAIALAQQHGGRRIAVWDARDVHDKRESCPCANYNNYFTCLQFRRKSPQTSTNPRLRSKTSRKFGLSGKRRPHYTPKLKKRTALVRGLKEVFRRHQSQPVERVISLINPVLRGWVNYFAVGHSSECFSFIKDWAEKKVRRHLAHARKRQGFGWKRWNRRWLYDTLGLFDSYRVKRSAPKVVPAG